MVAITLIAGYDGTNNGFNFDGYARTLLLTVPRGWLVRVTCENRGPLRNSCAVVHGPDAFRPAFVGATTPDPTVGLGAGTSAHFAFRASRTGLYRFTSLVPGHEEARMYDVLEVTGGSKPRIEDLVPPGH